MARRPDGSWIGASLVSACPDPQHCFAETDMGTGVTECNCGLVGYLKSDGQLDFHPDYREVSEGGNGIDNAGIDQDGR